MEVLNGVFFVRLRSVGRGKYLAADVDGRGVCLTGQRGTHNTVWAVQRATAPDGAPCVILRSCYGRYLMPTGRRASLLVPSRGVTTQQSALGYHPPPPAFLWRPARRRGSYVLRNYTGCVLRANGRYLRSWRKIVTAAHDSESNMVMWDIQRVPVRANRPNIVDPAPQLTHKHRAPPTEQEVTRQVRCIHAQPNGNFDHNQWLTLVLSSNDLTRLKIILASCMGHHVGDISICIKAGIHGRLSPLLIDLPIGNDLIDLVILSHNTPMETGLRFPDVEAP
ncbi:hypothetical protein ACP4OV_016566 [Aristida adscensionis]